ncbi:hypothetical protein HIM_02120 [Hirsutella minnesotensis 3608]|nr:hypothetical protein HIM_02120 [Hirsutella minnesotensis 3608]
MFSPSIADGGPATATRSRRRQRPKSSESLVQQPKAKRQRVPLTEQTFVNPEPQPEMVEYKAEKIATLGPKHAAPLEDSHHTPHKELSVRTKKSKHGDRAANKGDGSLVLASTNAFTASKLPALPDRIRSDWSGNQYAEIFSSTGYALTLTPAHAIVWPYNATSQSPETFTFTLPSASKPSDPLPVGCLVSPPASSNEPGLVVVMSGSGKVVYWESISSAATFAFIKKDRSGVEHVISGMSSGEKVVAITNAESAGFILTFSTGRLAYMSVRDGHGRPAISVQFLRTGLATPGAGFLGSIRNAFSHLSLRGDVAAVRADRSARVGERHIVALTSKGKLQSWAIHRGGHHEPTGDSDMRERLVAALQEADRASQEFPAESFEALDFTFVPKGLEHRFLSLSRLSDAMASDNPTKQHLLLLVSLTRKNVSRYALIETILTPDDCQIGMIRPITSYSTPCQTTDRTQSARPRIYLPRPALVAFVVFDHAAIIASVAVPPESPESQLQTDSHILPASFEDVVDFREDDVHEIVGSGFEETPAITNNHEDHRASRLKTKNPAVVLMVRGAGVVRIVTTDVDKFASDQPPRVSAKSKLEQAVFFGTRKDNPLVFDGRQDFAFARDEVTKAALEVSHQILCSSSPYTSTLPVSMEENLRARSHALERLMLHLKAVGADIDRTTRWTLLFDAERMHVAGLIWKRHEAFTASRPADDKRSLVGSIIEFVQEGHHNKPNKSIGEVDAIRHWFSNDIFRLELLVAWAYEVIKVMYKDNLLDDGRMTIMLHEAMRMNITAHTAAHDFRRANLNLYGLGQEQLKMGILSDGYEDLPEPWTGCMFVANNAKRLTDLCEQWVKKHEQQGRTADSILLTRMFDDLPKLIDGMLTTMLEYARWGNTRTDRKALAQEYAKSYNVERHDKTISLAHVGKWEQAAQIAEKHGCLSALAAIVLEHLDRLDSQLSQSDAPESELNALKITQQAKKTQVEDCLSKYGEAFAFPVYDFILGKHGVSDVLNFKLDTLGYKTRFLRSRPNLARISWINDVQQEKDLDHAADTLIHLALSDENQIWKKKIELSLGKLALLADAEVQSQPQLSFSVKTDKERREKKLERVDNALILVKIQDHLYSQILPSTYEALDGQAAVNFALEAHSTNIPRRQKALLQLFTDGMTQLLDHQILDPMYLIDLLTLVALGPEPSETAAHPFWLALKIADTACHSDEVKDAKNLIWRRLLIRDDWAKINDTQLKDDREVINRVADTELFAMFTDCIRFQNPNDPFRLIEPQDVLGAFTETLDRRFQNWKDADQIKLIEAMRHEDKVLTQYIEKNRLSRWVHWAYETAQAEAENIVEEVVRFEGTVVNPHEPFPPLGRRRSSATGPAASLLNVA